jgi:Carboxypeptidase regulatory-like domain
MSQFTIRESSTPKSARSKSAPSLLGGAALQRCDNRSLSSAGFSRCGPAASTKATLHQRITQLAAALLFLLPTLALAQTYRVAGTVISTEGHPLARARVSLADQRSRKPLASMLTTDDGRFEFQNVPAGKYPLTGAKSGYLTAAYNQHENFSTAIVTGAPGVDTEHLTLRLAPLAQIYGQVLDEHGDPIRKARVTIWQDDHSTGVSRTRRFNNDTIDDLGSFEFATLPPGTYFLSANAEPWYAVHPKATAIDVDRSLDVVYPTTYYSGATESDDATPILVRGGDHLQLDLHLLPVPPLHVLFHTPLNEQFSMPMLFKRVFDDLDIPDRQGGEMISPGVYEIVTAPGHFRVSLPSTPNSQARTADLDLAQDNQELDVSSGEPLATLTTTVEIPGVTQFPETLLISLRDAKGHRAATRPVDQKAGTTFTELLPGRYTLSAFGPSQPYAIASVAPVAPDNSRGKAISGNVIDLAPGSNLSLLLTLIGGSSTVEGFVQSKGKPFDGAMVVLVPAHPDAHLEFFRRDQSDLDGSFALPNAVPGPYTAVAIEDGWDLDWSKPNVIARYAAKGEKLTIPENTKTLHLPAPLELQPK